MKSDRSIWLITLVFFSPFFFVVLVIAGLLIYEPNTKGTLISLFKDLFMAALGTGLGIGWSLREARKQQTRLDLDSIISMIAAIEKIKEHCENATKAWENQKDPNFPLEGQRLGVLNERISRYSDVDLRTEIEGLAYQCSHYNSKLAVVNSVCVTAHVNNTQSSLLNAYRNDMKTHAGKICEWATSALEKLKKEGVVASGEENGVLAN